MSSARKRAAIQKANSEANFLRQRLMLAESHGNVMRGFAEVVARRSDVMYAALEKIASRTQSDGLLWWQIEAREALEKVGAGDMVPMGPNVEFSGAEPQRGGASAGTQG